MAETNAPKRGRPRKYATPEESCEANKLKVLQKQKDNKEKVREYQREYQRKYRQKQQAEIQAARELLTRQNAILTS